MRYFEPRKVQCEAWLKVSAEAIENPADFSSLIDVDQMSRTRRLVRASSTRRIHGRAECPGSAFS